MLLTLTEQSGTTGLSGFGDYKNGFPLPLATALRNDVN